MIRSLSSVNSLTNAVGTVMLQGKEAGLMLTDPSNPLLALRELSGGIGQPELRRQSSAERASARDDALVLAPLPLGSAPVVKLGTFGPTHLDTAPKATTGRFREKGDSLTSPEWNSNAGTGPKENIFHDCYL